MDVGEKGGCSEARTREQKKSNAASIDIFRIHPRSPTLDSEAAKFGRNMKRVFQMTCCFSFFLGGRVCVCTYATRRSRGCAKGSIDLRSYFLLVLLLEHPVMAPQVTLEEEREIFILF